MTPKFFYATFIYLIFVIYGSLVPLEFHDIPLENAFTQFKNIQYLDLGLESRADWVANILLYMPLAFFGAATFQRWRNPFIQILVSLITLTVCVTLAIVIEFTQLYFAPRTVSINDLIAETMGSAIGILLWQGYGQYFSKLYRQLSLGSFLSVKAGIILYVLFYVVLSIFPFDFVTSSAEFESKLASGNDHLVMSLDVCGQNLPRCIIKLVVEILVLVPLGFLICLMPHVSHKKTLALVFGFFLGIFIESVQLFLYSGSAQGISVLTRMLGIGLGVGVFLWASKQHFDIWKPRIRSAVYCVLLPYAILVMWVNGWLDGNWLTEQQVLEKLNETHFLPLYYYYYTTETVALVSLLSNIGLYLPVGLLFWAILISSPSQKKPHWIYVGLTAAVFALIIETGKLFLVDKHADPTDIWIAFVGAACTYSFMCRLTQWIKPDTTERYAQLNNTERSPIEVLTSQRRSHVPSSMRTETISIDYKYRSFSLILLIIIAWTLMRYPLGAGWLAVLLVVYAYIQVRFPYAWLCVIPALLPIMDFAPWTGWFFFDEFDLVILTTLAAYCWGKTRGSTPPLFSILTKLLLGIFYGCYLISLGKGIFPLAPLDANAFSNYYSNYNSLRVGKGVFWGVLLLPLLRCTLSRYHNSTRYFAYGVLLGLAGVVFFTIIERLVFVSLLDFDSDYRVNALFSSMHAGGGHIESYLMLSMPFIALLFLDSTHRLGKNIAGILLFCGSLYTLLVSYSRGGYVGFTVEFIVLLVVLWVSYRKQIRFTQKSLIILPVLAIIFFVALPVFRGNLIQQRFSVVEEDKDSRKHHWLDALTMMDTEVSTSLFGMGLGSYPRTFFWLNNEDTHPATYEIAGEKGTQFLRLRGGDALFLGQYLNIEPHQAYHLSLDVRGETSQSILSISLCEKSVQYSLRCSTVQAITAQQDWEHFDLPLNSNEVGERVVNGWLQRPIQLAFYNPNGAGKLLDVDNVKLTDANGANILENGDFSLGSDFWFFAAEKHNPWHIFNFWVHLVFDQGWLGAVAFSLVFLKAIINGCRNLSREKTFAPIMLAAFSGFMVVGFVDSPFDAPRLTLLFFLILFFVLRRSIIQPKSIDT